ncbi:MULTISPECIES: S8 family serine peptidase [Pseudoalteromonas]|uniref:Alkaline serine protease n=1 Tax=Pseudoalteromonas amylolytica TaxID=1859457 RepID=A0A1S1MVV1_9GAMM|nr:MULTISPECIES: S8 family serine peptidase [Pseudoalteromonas]OHU85372.1 alkaline serine protease [Pseudoalteromonas sp. JW3]OHU93007.1 alkaline serine protease [Pseudoalteromonas amylolytica]
MKKMVSNNVKLSVLSACVGAALSAGHVSASEEQRVIVTLNDSAVKTAPVLVSSADVARYKQQTLTTFAQQLNVTPMTALPSVNAVVMNVTPQKLAELKANPQVANVEVDPKRYLMAESTPYGINMVQANQLADTMSGNRKVCIMDTGYTLNHPDLPSTGITGNDGHGSNDTGNWYNDGNGHGTHVAGTIAAIGGNGQGVVGVNPSGQLGLHIVKVFNDQGQWAYGSDLIKAIEQCEASGANVTSMSLGGSGSSTAERNAFQQSYDRGVLHIAAAGNSGNSSLSYPASYDAVVSVAAVDSSENKASFSQYNNQVEIAAPGVGVNSTWNNNGYKSISGTSMATPHVSGVAALVWSHYPECTNDEIRKVLNATAKDKGAPGRDTSYGHGIVQAKAAYDYIAQNGCSGDPQPGPIASFSYSVNGKTVKFTNTSKDARSYSWQFGDGASSTEASPSHTYAAAGNYQVTLTAKDGEKSNSVTKTVTITGDDPKGCDGIAAWSSSKMYYTGDLVSYKNYKYEATWWSRSAQPDIFSNVWKRLGACN